ncbi:hypothetical protein D3C85_984850 [compost metagenome]
MTSTVLDIIYASGGPLPLSTLELSCSAWAAPILVCNGFEDKVCMTEDGRILTFLASNIEIAIPKKSNTGAQTLKFAIANIDGVAQRLIDQAIDAEAHCFITHRIYAQSNLMAPAEPPYRMRVTGGTMQGAMVQVEAGFGEIINVKWPRRLYTTDEFRGLTYT